MIRFQSAGFVLCLFVCVSCATRYYGHVDKAVYADDCTKALQELEKDKAAIYGNDAVLYYLDKGLIAHYAAAYKESSALLESGDRAIASAFTKSITQNIASFIANDTTIEYAGEDYEDLYLNIFNALNYYHRGNLEDAMVEIRRMQEKLRALALKYNVIEKKLASEDKEAAEKANVSVQFTNSALARYLGILFYRANGQSDDARIDRDSLKQAFASQKAMYQHKVPKSIDDELAVPAGMARLNVLAFTGLAPVKIQETLRVFLHNSSWIKIALPRMVKRPSQTASIELVFDNGKRFQLELLEDIQSIAIETFKKHQGIIEAKTLIRATIKGGAAAGLSIAGEQESNLALYLAGTLLQIFAEASEVADLRSSRYFPASAYIGAINLAPGAYSFTVNYYNVKGQQLASYRYADVPLAAGKLNLVETFYFK